MRHSRWTWLVFSVVLGIVLFIAAALGGHPDSGLFMFSALVLFGAGLLLAGVSESRRGGRGDASVARPDVTATAWSGVVVLLAVIGAFTAEIAQGHNGAPYDWLAAVGSLAYVVAVVLQRRRG
ncbi:MAG TPA: hypothetical protein VGQ62_01880 [Chloroflexota bacterium]|nr:hypothetical protein [Chloroflexota bacterium]